MNNIALGLSGGGFRATFFHLGVTKLLWDCGFTLPFVRDVFSVSGGSVLAANLAANWDTYRQNGSEHAFYESASPLFRLAQRDVRGRIIRRWLLYGWLPAGRRSRLLAREYYRGVSDAELGAFVSYAPYKELPNFHFLATSLTTGRSVEFTADGFYDGETLHRARATRVAFAVAASSAFPPLFPPLKITHNDLVVPLAEFPGGAQQLTDGGVYDNLGIARMRKVVACVHDARRRGRMVRAHHSAAANVAKGAAGF